MPNVQPFVNPEWSVLGAPGAKDVQVRLLWHQDGLLLAQLRFGEHANIHEHAGENDAYVSCLEGSGFTSVGGVAEPIEAGQRVLWPKGVVHNLWTDGSSMATLMCERYRP